MTTEQIQNIVKILISRRPNRVFGWGIEYNFKDNIIIQIHSTGFVTYFCDNVSKTVDAKFDERDLIQIKWQIEDWYKLFSEELESNVLTVISDLPDTSQDDLLTDSVSDGD